MISADVVIVGGGPAGLCSAIALGRHGLRVVVLERGSLPRDKACGEGVMPTGLQHLASLGISAHLDWQKTSPMVGVRYHSRTGVIASAHFAEGPGRAIRRTLLSSALESAVHRWPDVRLHVGEAVERIDRSNRGVVVRTSVSSYRTRLVLGADGLHSRTRALLNPKLPSRAADGRYGIRQHFRVAPPSHYVEVYWSDGAEAYVTPVDHETTGVAVLWHKKAALPGHGAHSIETPFGRLLRRFPEVEAHVSAAAVDSDVKGAGPFHQRVRCVVDDGVALVGDAAGYLDAITGEGVSLASADALALERYVVPILVSQDPPSTVSKEALAPYADALRAIRAPCRRTTRLALLLSAQPWLADRAIAALAKEPRLFQHFLSANMGCRPAFRLPARESARALAAMFTFRAT